MTTVCVDLEDLLAATPQVEHLIALLDDASRSLSGVAVPAGVPAGLAARVAHTTASAGRDLRTRARMLDPLPGDLRRRAAAAKLAGLPWLTASGWGMKALGLFVHSFSMQTLSKSMTWGLAARELRSGLASGETYGAGRWSAFRLTSAAAKEAGVTRGVPAGLAKGAAVGGRALTGASWALAAYSNVRDPRLSVEQKVGRTGATIATGTGVSILAGAASGAAFGSAAGPLGTLVGLGAGTAWTLLDSKYHVSAAIGDAAADVADTVGDTAGDVAGTVGHGAKSVAGKALGVVGL